MSRISGRLSALRNIKKETPVSEPTKSKMAPEPLNGWKRKPEGFWFRETRRILPEFKLSSAPLLLAEDFPIERLYFYDTETTGLSGGSGNTVFLAGYGFYQDKTFVVRQYFLEDYPGEKPFLEALTADWPQDGLYISYNGRSFDNPLLRTRFLMNGMPYPERDQLDLLFPARRLWKTMLPNCSLGTIEQEVLGKIRKEDLPGREAPQAWFDFLKEGRTEKLRLIFEHNLEDIISLAELLMFIESLSGVVDLPLKTDSYGLALLLFSKNPKRSLPLLRSLCEKDEYRALHFLSAYFKKQKLYDEALPLWQQMIRLNKSLYAVEEAAKYYEHREKNITAALSCVEERLLARWPLTEKDRGRLTKRLKRLQIKLKRQQ